MRWRMLEKVAAAAALLVSMALPAAARAQAPVDLALVLAVDASASITDGGWTFQLRGHSAAFRNPRVADAIASGPHGRIAVTVARFAGPNSFSTLVPWTVVGSAAEAEAFAAAIDAAPTTGRGGATAVGSAMDAAAKLLATAPGEPPRRTIDLSSNGFSNAGIAPEEAKPRLEAAGITLNALVILDEYDWLEEYYQENVIAGPGAFVRTAEDRDSFYEAILGKLVLEISARPDPQSGTRAFAAR